MAESANRISFEGLEFDAAQAIETLAPFLTDQRKEKIETILNQRCEQVQIALEDVFDAGNIFAVFRTAEALGFQNVHLIDNTETMKKIPNRGGRKAQKWLKTQRWDNSLDCLRDFKKNNFQILATSLDAQKDISEINFNRPSLILFGNEHEGVGTKSMELADQTFRLPMVGFTQSYNISVAAAVCLYHIYQSRMPQHGDLSEEEKLKQKALYYCKSSAQASKLLLKGNA